MMLPSLCAAVLALGHAGPEPVARATCEHVAASAEAHGVPVALALALAWHESRLSPAAVSRRGAVGPLQVMPATLRRCRFARPDCDHVQAGVVELARLLGRHAPVRALCHYNAGPACGPMSMRWARAVLRTASMITVPSRGAADEAAVSASRASGAPPEGTPPATRHAATAHESHFNLAPAARRQRERRRRIKTGLRKVGGIAEQCGSG